MQDLIRKIETTIHSEIPLSVSMGVRLVSFDQQAVVVEAPLALNINHKETAFGGSLYNVSVLAGWAAVYGILLQQQLSAHVVIQKSQIDYINPVTSDIIGKCLLPPSSQIRRFVQTFEKHDKARMSLTTTIHDKDKLAVTFVGQYVVHV